MILVAFRKRGVGTWCITSSDERYGGVNERRSSLEEVQSANEGAAARSERDGLILRYDG